jgi:hypothetical protein
MSGGKDIDSARGGLSSRGWCRPEANKKQRDVIATKNYLVVCAPQIHKHKTSLRRAILIPQHVKYLHPGDIR